MKNSQSWWSKKEKNGKINFILLCLFWALAVTLLVIAALGDTLFASGFTSRVLALNKPLAGGWDDIWPRLVGMDFLAFSCAGCLNDKLTDNRQSPKKVVGSVPIAFSRGRPKSLQFD